MIRKYTKELFRIIKFYDAQPLLLFWSVSDILNNQILWTDYNYWLDLGQPNTYWLYSVYFIASLGILLSLASLKWCSRFVSFYLILYLFSTIRYLVDLYNSNDFIFDTQAIRSLSITFLYFTMWVWIWSKLKREKLYRKLNNGQ
jgi:hypothetical protein